MREDSPTKEEWYNYSSLVDLRGTNIGPLPSSASVRAQAFNACAKQNLIEHAAGNLGECCLCLQDVCGGQKVVRLLCNHVGHAECMIAWLKKSRSCPLCRRPSLIPHEQKLR